MAQNDKIQRGNDIASITSTYKDWPTDEIVESGLCQLRSQRGREQKLNRHYAVSGPSFFDISRSYDSRNLGNERALYAMFSFIEHGQYEASDCVRSLSILKAQVGVTHLQYCRQIRQEPSRYITLRGKIHRVCSSNTEPIFCSNGDCPVAVDEALGGSGMYHCGMPAVLPVVETGDRVDILYDTKTDNGRLLGVVHRGNTRVDLYNFTPEPFIVAGGFANVTLDLILARAN